MLDIENTTIICIDIQDKLVKMLENGDEIKSNNIKLLKTANILNIKTIVTEQYPKGLGCTVDEIKEIADFETVEKTTFSAIKTENFPEIKTENVVISGIETHICVYQTALDLLQQGINVYVVKDCCASRSKSNHKTALHTIEHEGARIITLEMALFDFLKSSKHPKFKEVQSLIK